MTLDSDPVELDEARALLRAAGRSIELDRPYPASAPAPAIGEPAMSPRRSMVPVVAAAVAIIVTVVLVAALPPWSGDTRTDPGPSNRPADTSMFILGPDQMPVVFGLSEASAETLLDARGLTVVVTRVASCSVPGGAPIRTEPSVGAPVRRGETVRLFVAAYPRVGEECRRRSTLTRRRDDAYRLVQAAIGQAAPPAAAPDVDVDALLAAVRANLPAVRSAVQPLRFTQSRLLGFFQPSLTIMPSSKAGCYRRRSPLQRMDGWFHISLEPRDIDYLRGAPVCRGFNVRWDGREITGVWTSPEMDGPLEHLMPDVVGNTPAFAEQRLAAAGYRAVTHAEPSCRGFYGLVVRQQPTPAQPATTDTPIQIGYSVRAKSCPASPSGRPGGSSGRP